MGPKNKKIESKLNRATSFLVFAFCVTACFLTIKPSIYALLASQNLDIPMIVGEGKRNNFKVQRQKIQSHYLQYGIYIPFDDIILTREEKISPRYLRMLRKSCGRGHIFIWVPFRIKVPLTGEKVFEWCLTQN